MSFFLVMAFLFFVGCIGGWCLELLFRRVVHHKWINPGFLIGPYLPLYGTGLALMFCICAAASFINTGSRVWNDIFTVAIITAAMTLLEYITGLIFIKGMGIKLWDYSKSWGNIQGIICPLFTLFWGLIGAAYYFFVHKLVIESLYWFKDNLAFSFVVGFFFGVIAIDAAYSLKLTAKIKTWACENQVVVRYEELKESIHDRVKSNEEKLSFLFATNSVRGIREELDNYLSTHQLPRINKRK